MSIVVGYVNDEIYDIVVKYVVEYEGFKINFYVGYLVNKDGGSNVGGNSLIML